MFALKEYFIVFIFMLVCGCNDANELPSAADEVESTKSQTEFFIAPNGTDGTDGTIENPCRTITHVLTRLPSGGTINVRSGNYTESEIWIRNIATASERRLIIQAYQNEKPIFSNNARQMIIESDNVTIRGLEFANGKYLTVVNGHSGAHVVGNKFTGRGTWAAISVEGSFCKVEGNTIALDGNTQGTQGHGIYIAEGHDNQVIGNDISGMTGYAAHVFDQPRSGDTAPRRIEDVIIAYNICHGSRERAGIIVAAATTTQASEVHVYRNIVYDCAGNGITMIDQVHNSSILNNTIYNVNTNGVRADGEDGIYVGVNTYGIRVANNIVWMNRSEGHHVAVEDTGAIGGNSNLCWPGLPRLLNFTDRNLINADPRFRNAAAYDFYLLDGSPAIDAGMEVDLPYWGKAIDIGAVEHKPAGTGVH